MEAGGVEPEVSGSGPNNEMDEPKQRLRQTRAASSEKEHYILTEVAVIAERNKQKASTTKAVIAVNRHRQASSKCKYKGSHIFLCGPFNQEQMLSSLQSGLQL